MLSNAVGEDRAARDRLESLQRGQKFLKKTLMGLSTQEIHLKMSEDASSIEWRIDATRLSKAEYGEVDLTAKVRCVKLVGTAGMQFISNEGGGGGEKSLLEVHAEDAAVRDRKNLVPATSRVDRVGPFWRWYSPRARIRGNPRLLALYDEVGAAGKG